MPKIRVVIIEDEFFVADHLNDLITSMGYAVEGVYHNGEDFLKQTDWNFDIAVLDIFLSKEMTGIDVAKELNEQKKAFIFLTANQDAHTIKEAARQNPDGYITKPFKQADISATLEIIAHRLPELITIRGTHKLEYLNPGDILFIKSDGVYIEIYTVDTMIVQRKLLKEIVAELPDSFQRVHRSFLVNPDYIDQQTATHIMLRGHEIPVSRGYKKEG